jgi:hypothetical protein
VSNSAKPIDVHALVDDIQAGVAAKRARGEYPKELLDDLSREFEIANDPPEVLSLIQSSRPLRSDKPVIGKVVVKGKKAVRRLLAWYVHPIAADQTRFNDAITRELRSLERRVQAAETSWKPGVSAHLPAAEARGKALKASLQNITGAVLSIGSSISELGLGANVIDFDFDKPRAGDRLLNLTSGSFAAVVMSGVLQRASGREITALLQTAGRVLEPGGIVLVEGPDPDDPACPPDPSGVDISMRRWLSTDTVDALLIACGFVRPSHSLIDATPRWYLIVASRTE